MQRLRRSAASTLAQWEYARRNGYLLLFPSVPRSAGSARPQRAGSGVLPVLQSSLKSEAAASVEPWRLPALAGSRIESLDEVIDEDAEAALADDGPSALRRAPPGDRKCPARAATQSPIAWNLPGLFTLRDASV
jgi:hypothetical protein